MDPFRSNPEDNSDGEQEFQAACYQQLTGIGSIAWELFAAIEDLPWWKPQARDLPEVERLHHEMVGIRNRLAEMLGLPKE